MTEARAVELQTAVYAQLSSALASAAPDGSGIDVFDHIPSDPDRMHVRIDSFTVFDDGGGGVLVGRHVFDVHVFDRPGDSGNRGQLEVKRVLGLIVAALRGLRPIGDAGGAIRREDSFVTNDVDGSVHGRATFTVYLGET